MFFDWLAAPEQAYLPASPMAAVRRPRQVEATREAFSAEEARRLVSYAAQAPGILGKRDKALVLFLLATGGRAKALLSLRDEDINDRLHEVMLTEKGGKKKRARLGRKAWDALREWRKCRPMIPGNPIWVTQRNTAMNYSTLNALLHRLGEYAGVPDCIPHRFRHTAATQYTMTHHDPMATKAFLGHAKLATTERYLQSLGADHYLGLKLATPDEWLG